MRRLGNGPPKDHDGVRPDRGSPVTCDVLLQTKRQRNNAHIISYSVSIRFVITVLCPYVLSLSY